MSEEREDRRNLYHFGVFLGSEWFLRSILEEEKNSGSPEYAGFRTVKTKKGSFYVC